MISTIMFAIASWIFFHRRIPYEEATLLKMFPEEYPKYRIKTYIGIPFINPLHT
jgi:protein-S-isoprenylcysteine O-methyltransferase